MVEASNKVPMIFKDQGHSLTKAKGHSDLKIKTFFYSVGSFETEFYMKSNERMGMKIYTNEFGHMTKMATMPIYGKTFKKSSPEPIC